MRNCFSSEDQSAQTVQHLSQLLRWHEGYSGHFLLRVLRVKQRGYLAVCLCDIGLDGLEENSVRGWIVQIQPHCGGNCWQVPVQSLPDLSGHLLKPLWAGECLQPLLITQHLLTTTTRVALPCTVSLPPMVIRHHLRPDMHHLQQRCQ